MEHNIKTHGINTRRRDFILKCNEWCADHADLQFVTIQIESKSWDEAKKRLGKFLEVVKSEAITVGKHPD